MVGKVLIAFQMSDLLTLVRSTGDGVYNPKLCPLVLPWYWNTLVHSVVTPPFHK